MPAVPGGRVVLLAAPAKTRTKPSALPKVAAPTAATIRSVSTAPNILAAASTNGATLGQNKPFAFRLSNTTKTIGQLTGDRHAILLENALIDTSLPLNLIHPEKLAGAGRSRALTSSRRAGRLTPRFARCSRARARKSFPTFPTTPISCAPRRAWPMDWRAIRSRRP